MIDITIGFVIGVVCTIFGWALANNITVIDCATKGTANLNGTKIECAVTREGQQP